MQIQALCERLKPADYKPKGFMEHVSYLKEVLRQEYVSIHLDSISHPSRDIKSLAVPIRDTVRSCVCVLYSYSICVRLMKQEES